MSIFTYLIVKKVFMLILADLTLALFVKIECIWKYVITERVPKVTKMPKVS